MTAAARPAGAAHPGRNGAIVFVSNGEIWTMRADGRTLRRLTRNNLELTYWSRTERVAVNADGSGVRQLTRLRRGAGEPDWGPAPG